MAPKQNKKTYQKKGYKKKGAKGNSNVAKLSNDSYHTETIKGFVDHDGAGNKCVSTIPCGPAGKTGDNSNVSTAAFPQWAALALKYNEYRVVYASITSHFQEVASADAMVLSLVERDGTKIEDEKNMLKDPLTKVHSLDSNQNTVFRGWKPSTSSDYDFIKTAAPGTNDGVVPAYIKMLQMTPSKAVPKCKLILTLKIQFRDAKN